MRVNGIIFDMDGTLLDSMGIWKTLGSDYLRGRGVQPEPGLDERLKAMSLRQALADSPFADAHGPVYDDQPLQSRFSI